MLQPEPPLVALMSFGHGVPSSGEDMPEFYESISGDWTDVDASSFVGVTHPYCTGSMVPGTILTPISLPESSYRPSPALSPQEYQYPINSPIQPPQGLGITAPFPSDFPLTTAPHTGYVCAPEDVKFSTAEISALSPQLPPAKRVKRNTSKSSSDIPANILPNPESLQRMEDERQHRKDHPQPIARPRAPGRGRRKPQAEEEDAFVEELREQKLKWKTIREMFQERFNKDATVANLQMRLSRRRKERLALWNESDIKLLLSAHEVWESEKYNFIAEKMKELGSINTYTPEQCKTQLQHLETKQRHRDVRNTSPSAISDAPHSPMKPRKRAAPARTVEEEESRMS